MQVRPYEPADEVGWLRCRVLSFLATAYFDDVVAAKPRYEERSVELVAVDDGAVVGVLDLTLPDDPAGAATVETVAVHPDHQGRGVGTALLAAVEARVAGGCGEVEAWTRDDPATLGWYRARGFTEDSHYLHVHKDWDEPTDRVEGLPLVKGFLHCTDLSREAELRARFRRVHVCRRMRARVGSLRFP
ncbi:GNAT family N-acetyltransferase [Angustibacter speluncae]